MKIRSLMVTALSAVLLAIQTVVSAAQVPTPVPGSMSDLLDSFENEPVFWKQVEVAKQIIARGDKTVLPGLEHWLSDEDRHRRGNAALIFGGLGDPRGLDTIVAMLTDFSDRPEGQGIPGVFGDGRYHVAQQIKSDRYYAVHLERVRGAAC
jgi:hypothetical protein